MRAYLTYIFLFITIISKAQLTDSLTDGNFTNNPPWTGTTSTWVVNANMQLQSNGIAADTSYLSTASSIINNIEWRFYIKQTFAGSASNYGRVYLVSNQADLKNALNGYFLLFGESGSNDSIRFYRQDGISTSATLLAACANGSIVNSTNANIKVTRDNNGLWNISVDYSGGNNLTLAATVTDNTYTATSFFGVFAKYTASNSTNFIYDNFYIGNIITDVTPPIIVSASVISANQLDVLFSEPVDLTSSQITTNYSINSGILNPANAMRDGSNNALVHLTLAQNLINNTNYIITINNIADLSSNIIASNSTSNFSYALPGVAQFGDVIINELYPDQTPLVGLPNAEFVEIYNRSTNSFNLTGWVLSDPSANATIGNYQLLPGQYLILCANADTSLFQPFGAVKGIPSFPSLNSASDRIFLKNDLGTFIDSVNYSDTWYQDAVKAVGGWTLELKNPNIPSDCAGGSNWLASNAIIGGTPGQLNSVFNGTSDIIAPTISSIIANNPLSITICFSEPIQPSQAQVLSNYTVSNSVGSPSNVSYVGACAVLTFLSPLSPGLSYTVTLSNISDCSGNAISTAGFLFTYFVPQPFDVVINEIMADPSPIVGLPDAEYIELFNRTAFPINTTGWSLTYGSTQKTLPAVILPADSFLVLTTTAGLADLAQFGNVAAVSTLSSTALTNAGTSLILKDNNNVIIHGVNYADSWYNDAVKILGGWSLEMIDPNNPCAGSSNWNASTNFDGGTPGKKNAIFAPNPDNISPNLAGVEIISATQITAYFSEPVTNTAAINGNNFVIDNSIGSPVSISFIGTPAYAVTLNLAASLNTTSIYNLTLNYVLTDCAGNSSAASTSSIFANYEAKPFDIVINEIMVDPDPVVGLPPFEYVELFNKSTYPINLSNWNLKYSSNSKALPSAIINPGEYVVLTSSAGANLLQGYGKTIVVDGFSSSALTNSGTNLILTNVSGTIIHAIAYTDAWYGNSLKALGGWSLEQIDVNNPCSGITNWKASEATAGGTPCTINSIAAANPDTQAPTISGICINSFNTITVQFSEPQDSLSLINTTTYFANNGLGNPSSVFVEGPFYDKVTLAFANSFANNTIYNLSILGAIKDCAGNTFVSGTSDDFSLYEAKPYEIVINEIMADETPVVGLPASEYIELYNKSSFPISLNNYNLSISTTNTIIGCASIKANGYLVMLPKNQQVNESIYGKCYTASSYTSLTNTGTEITFKNPVGIILSSVTFSDSWYANAQKKEGGWSLEQKDPNNPCAGISNWAASNNGNGGTPGKINSVNSSNPDLIAPEILRIAYINPTTIVVYFNEPLQAATLYNTANYSIDNGIGQPNGVYPNGPNYNSLSMLLNSPIQSGTIYHLTIIGNIADCVGNIVNTTIVGKFGIPQNVSTGDLVLNELLFNPYDEGVDFVEFYNNSNKLISLNKIEMSNVDTAQKTVSNKMVIDSLGYLVFPNEYYVITTNSSIVQNQYKANNPKAFIDVSSMPSLNVGDGSFALSLKNDSIIDGMMYTENMHYPLLSDKKGISLERISFSRSTSDASNWHSASESIGFATPGLKNSQFVATEIPNETIVFANEIFSPDNDGYNDVLVANYNVETPGWVGNASVYDVRGRLIKKLLENKLLGTEGSFSWDGINVDNEKAAIGVYSLYFEYFDAKGEVKKVRKSFVLAGKL